MSDKLRAGLLKRVERWWGSTLSRPKKYHAVMEASDGDLQALVSIFGSYRTAESGHPPDDDGLGCRTDAFERAVLDWLGLLGDEE